MQPDTTLITALPVEWGFIDPETGDFIGVKTPAFFERLAAAGFVLVNAEEVMGRILEAALPTGGSAGPNAWTEERIAQRSRLAKDILVILRERGS